MTALSVAEDARKLAQEAKDLAAKVEGEQSGHEKLCADRYATINKTLGLILKVLSWGGAALFGTLIAVVGWFYVQQSDISRQQIQTLQTEIQAQHDRGSQPR